MSSLLAQRYEPIEIIVVDNASADGSSELVMREFPSVRVLRNRYNLGFAGGCNMGLRGAQGEVLLLLNQDTQVDARWVGALVEALLEPGVGIVGSKILYPDGETLQHAGGWMEWPLALSHHYGQHESDTGEWDQVRSVEFVTGAAMAFRRDLMDEIGLLDEGFSPGYFEDADYCFRAREAGYEVRYVPSAMLTHQESTSVTDKALLSRYYQRGRLRFLLKHMEPERFLEEFVGAEACYQRPAIFGRESLPLRLAYLEAIPGAISILRAQWEADEQVVQEVIHALQQLHQLAWSNDAERVTTTLGPLTPSPDSEVTEEAPRLPSANAPDVADSVITGSQMGLPSLELFEFRSSLPMLGPLLSRFRSAWFNVAARWGMQHLMVQQEAINHTLVQALNHAIHDLAALTQQQLERDRQQNRYIHSLEQRLVELTAENELLAGEIAALRLEWERERNETQE
ncbi:MAG: glycosyltransferase [Chloroflexota bacterium]|nr:glycosyltransferase [Chloroflexota bacterium]